MIPRSRFFYVIAVTILLVAAALRFSHSSYAHDQICLTVPQEAWLYDVGQASSLYAWDVTPPTSVTVEDLEHSQSYPRIRTALVTSDALLLARFGGALSGLITVALTLHLAVRLQSNWWWVAGLFVAVAPWFVEADRWVIRFDPAILAVAMCVTALVFSARNTLPDRMRTGLAVIGTLAALSLLLLAPPLWWLAAGLLLLQTRRNWRLALFITISLVISVPALRSPLHWLNAVSEWDTGATAACVWGLLSLGLWHFRRFEQPVRWALAGSVLIAGAVTLFNLLRLPSPMPVEWELVGWLQERIPDNSLVRFDRATWHLAPVVSCPLGAHIVIDSQPIPASLPSLPGRRDMLPADYIVTTNPEVISGSSFVHDLGNGYYIGREIELPNPVDIRFGDLIYVIGYELITPQAKPGELVDVRLDFQFTSMVTVDALAYSAFFHVIVPGQPAEKVAEFSLPFIQEFQVAGPRQLVLNDHYRFPLPTDTPPGTYEIIFGIFDVYSGERLRWVNGDTLSLGQLDVRPNES
jgi:hypothetical protein